MAAREKGACGEEEAVRKEVYLRLKDSGLTGDARKAARASLAKER